MTGGAPPPEGAAIIGSVRFEADEADAGARLDRAAAARLPEVSRARLQSWIRSGRVRVAGEVRRRGAFRLRGGETVEIDPAPLKPLKAEPEAAALTILYEDEDLAVIDKPAGMAVHAGAGAASGTLVNALLHHFESLSGVSGELRPGIVHRLDRLTSGVLLAAKRDRAHRRLQAQFQARKIDKIYWAAVHGAIPENPNDDPAILRRGRPLMSAGRWWVRFDAPIRRDKRNRVKMAVSANGREAVSDVRLLRGNAAYSLVEVRIYTGRTHQIRVHLSAAGHPVVGDSLYGARKRIEGVPLFERFYLHARRIAFEHPSSGAAMAFEAPLPPEFEDLLRRLRL